MKNIRKPIVLFLILGVCGVCALGIIAILALLGPRQDFSDTTVLTTKSSRLGHDFLSALKDEDYDRAYEMLAPHLQREMNTVEIFRSSLLQSGVNPKSWNWTSSSDNTGIANAEVTMKDGTQASVTLVVRQLRDDGSLVLTEYRFSRN